jgi:hypothetical protein
MEYERFWRISRTLKSASWLNANCCLKKCVGRVPSFSLDFDLKGASLILSISDHIYTEILRPMRDDSRSTFHSLSRQTTSTTICLSFVCAASFQLVDFICLPFLYVFRCVFLTGVSRLVFFHLHFQSILLDHDTR